MYVAVVIISVAKILILLVL